MLNARLVAYLNYIERLATQPPNRWEGFYLTKYEPKYFGLRFQIAFACYALGALCCHPEASIQEQQRCQMAMGALIDRMLQRRIWAYWGGAAEHHGYTPDPIAAANLQYSGHLAMMIGIFEVVGGDQRYDEPFSIFWNYNERFVHTHTTLVDAIVQRMRTSFYHGMEDKPDSVTVASMNHALWANTLHDGLHDSTYHEYNHKWLTFLQQRLVLRGPCLPGRGVFSVSYKPSMRMALPLSFNFSDAWSLAFLAGIDPELTRQLALRFFKRLRRIANADAASAQVYAPSASMWQPREIADVTACTGFAYLLAVELEDADLAAALLRYADAHFNLVENVHERYYTGGIATLYTTALFALGEAGGLRGIRAALLEPPLISTTIE